MKLYLSSKLCVHFIFDLEDIYDHKEIFKRLNKSMYHFVDITKAMCNQIGNRDLRRLFELGPQNPTAGKESF